jgi:DNA-binding Xre family transcriptional regulator
MQKRGFKTAVAREFKELVLSELVLAIMAQDSKSVRELANEVGLSKTVIQNLRSGEQSDMKLSNFVKLTHAYGYDLVLEKEGQRISL